MCIFFYCSRTIQNYTVYSLYLIDNNIPTQKLEFYPQQFASLSSARTVLIHHRWYVSVYFVVSLLHPYSISDIVCLRTLWLQPPAIIVLGMSKMLEDCTQRSTFDILFSMLSKFIAILNVNGLKFLFNLKGKHRLMEHYHRVILRNENHFH